MADVDALQRFEPFVSLGTSLAVGLLVGFEREQSAAPTEPDRPTFFGGARTYPLVALCGSVAMLLAPAVGYGLVLAGFLALTAFLVVAFRHDLTHARDAGLTSEIAFLVTYLLGALAAAPQVLAPTSQRVMVIFAVGVVVALVLSMKPMLHALAQRTTKADVYATVKFLMVAAVVLPLLPDGPVFEHPALEAVNPYKVGLMVTLIAGVDFVGYVAVRALGAGRGLGLTGVVGGLVSSTAVTLSMSSRARSEPTLARACAMAVIAASCILGPRLLAVLAVVHSPLAARVAVPLGAMTVAGAGVALVWYLRDAKQAPSGTQLELHNPFELMSAVKFGGLFLGVLIASRFLTDQFGASGSYVAGLLAGATDVDAISLTMADLARGGLALNVAVTTVVIATASNTLVKGGIAASVGGGAFARRVVFGYALMLLAGGAGVAGIWLTGS